MDWGQGHYEEIAVGLAPATEAVIERATPHASERVLDVGCGTGNAALLAAERGAQVTGIDPSERLLEVARSRAAARKLSATFARGEASSVPLPDASAELVLSVFGVIFAPDAKAAASELARVTAPGGRFVNAAWIPEGALSELGKLRRQALANPSSMAPSGPPPFAWHERAALTDLFGPFQFSVELFEYSIAFTAESPQAFVDAEMHHHPMWVAGREQLQQRGEWQTVRARAIEIVAAANEQPGACKLTSRYVVSKLQRT
jgi:SAM-dependent methyltransferase